MGDTKIVDKSKIRWLVLDVDGTLTDGKLYIGKDGELCKAFDVKDGCGIHDILPVCGIEPVILTARRSEIVARRCEELGVRRVYQGVRDKVGKLHALCAEAGYRVNEAGVYEEIAYMGDDLLDLAVMKVSAVAACPADAAHQVWEQADFISNYNGGNGAVREFIEYLCGNYASRDFI